MKKQLRDCNLTKVDYYLLYFLRRHCFILLLPQLHVYLLLHLSCYSSSLGVKGILIMNADGQPIRSNLPVEDTDNYTALVSQVILNAALAPLPPLSLFYSLLPYMTSET